MQEELKKISLSSDITSKLLTPFPDYCIRVKPDKNKSRYVTGQAVIDRLNAVFGFMGWSWEIEKAWIEKSVPKMTKVKWENNKKVELVEPICEQQLPVAHVIGKLTVQLEDSNGNYRTICKTAPGAQCIVGGQSEQENCFKGAHTDAIKKAATMLGIALELYRNEDEDYYFQEIHTENPWTEELMQEKAEQIQYIEDYRMSYGISDEDFDAYVYDVTQDSLTPENIDFIVDEIKKHLSANEQEVEEE